MKIPRTLLSVAGIVGIIVGTNPSQMNATSLFLVICSLVTLVAYVGYRLLTKLTLRTKLFEAGKSTHKSKVLAAGTLMFMFLLNVFGTLTFRDFVLALILSGVVSFYLSKYQFGTE